MFLLFTAEFEVDRTKSYPERCEWRERSCEIKGVFAVFKFAELHAYFTSIQIRNKLEILDGGFANPIREIKNITVHAAIPLWFLVVENLNP